MTNPIEKFMINVWNRIVARPSRSAETSFTLGQIIKDGGLTKNKYAISEVRRTEHIAVVGKTGSGKSSLLRHMALQDIKAKRGFVFFDHHGEDTGLLLSAIRSEELRTKEDLSQRLILIEPADNEYSVGLNILDCGAKENAFLYVAGVTEILRRRCEMESFGPRTEELLRNALFVLAENNFTLLELHLLFTNEEFRTKLLDKTSNPEVKEYFEQRFAAASDAMRHVMSEPVLNKVSAFTADPHFRHILGQKQSSFDLISAIDSGAWIIMNLSKGKLGAHAATLGALFLAKLKSALFARRSRKLFTVYGDEFQNLVAANGDIEVVFAELRKFGVGVVAANQYLEQYPPSLKAAIFALGTHICFNLSAIDAEKFAHAFDGGKTMASRLKNLPQRHFIIRSGHQPTLEVEVPTVKALKLDATGLRDRSLNRFAKKRIDVEAEIKQRREGYARLPKEVLDAWD